MRSSVKSVADPSAMSPECALAQRPEYKSLHRDCRRIEDIPLPGGTGIVLMPRCSCGCHSFNKAKA
ncbi:hypothetical protein [Streptomyces sp. NPDC051677]|uniref:hypothetical protein n=1 Tax=Streptomyces sp. NPDC051677 TaxID=3365669 RepID=UPI0037D50B40